MIIKLQDIQLGVEEAQEAIKDGHLDRVQTVLWPSIKSALGQCDDLEWKYRGDMMRLIHKLLDDQYIQGGKPTQIDLKELKEDLQAGRKKAPKPEQVYSWLPW